MSSPYANSSLQAHSQIPRMDSYDYGMVRGSSFSPHSLRTNHFLAPSVLATTSSTPPSPTAITILVRPLQPSHPLSPTSAPPPPAPAAPAATPTPRRSAASDVAPLAAVLGPEPGAAAVDVSAAVAAPGVPCPDAGGGVPGGAGAEMRGVAGLERMTCCNVLCCTCS